VKSGSIRQYFEKETEEYTLDKALRLAVKVLAKTMDSTALTPDKLEIGVLHRVNDEVVFKQLGPVEVEALLKEAEAEKKEKDDS